MRIAIVNDMLMAVEAMRRVLRQAPQHELAWIARDGAEAVERCAQDRPDLILMDLIMPVMDGVEATRRIMARTPCAIVVVTANVDANSSKVFDAMGAGALDAVNTPILEGSGATGGAEALLRKIETIHRLLGAPVTSRQSRPAGRVFQYFPLRREHLVAIGASAGGPAAVVQVLAHVPADFPAAIVVVQHVDEQFAAGLADWLTLQSGLKVRLANDGDQPRPGTVLLAGRENHLVFLSPTRVGYVAAPLDCSYRPSVDVFFKSVLRHWPGDVTGVLLTGMGRDGAEGLKALRDAGHVTLVQDRATSAVYGMPKAAAELNAASEILPLERIGPRLIELLLQKTARRSSPAPAPKPLPGLPRSSP